MTETTFTLRDPPYAYLQLQVTLYPSSQTLSLDDIMLKAHLNNALSQYLGITGTAIPIDILKVEGSHAWIRLPREDESAVVAALSQWAGKGGVSIRAFERSSWLGMLTAGADDTKLWSTETSATEQS